MHIILAIKELFIWVNVKDYRVMLVISKKEINEVESFD